MMKKISIKAVFLEYKILYICTSIQCVYHETTLHYLKMRKECMYMYESPDITT